MVLHKLSDFEPNYREHFDDRDLIGFGLYSGDEKVGSVDDLLVDDEGRFRYLVINTGLWIFGKKVLLPIGQTRIDYTDQRVVAAGLTREQVEHLPEFTNVQDIDFNYEERVRNSYRSIAANRTAAPGTTPVTPGHESYRYDHDPALYQINDHDHGSLRLYEERLVTNKQRQKVGEVNVGKHVVTEQAQVSVPIEKERVVVERSSPVDTSRSVAPGEATFQEGEVARIEVYEEVPNIQKEAFVREEVNVRKVVERDVKSVEDEVRREELDIDTEGHPVVDASGQPVKVEGRKAVEQNRVVVQEPLEELDIPDRPVIDPADQPRNSR